jgi:transcriptional regulator with XRE-family HTH domain
MFLLSNCKYNKHNAFIKQTTIFASKFILQNMLNIHTNIKLLRQRNGLTQKELAEKCSFTRSMIAGYESSIQPTLSALLKLSEVLHVSTDFLLKENMGAWTEVDFTHFDNRVLNYAKGEKTRILAISVSKENEDNCEMVPVKASAGYLQAYADPEFIKNLPNLNLPMLQKTKKHRAFQIQGDSMPPIHHNDWVIGSYVENWVMLKEGEKYIVITQNDGIVLKTVYNKLAEKQSLLMVSSNPYYKPYYLPASEIMEVWKLEWWITNQDKQ